MKLLRNYSLKLTLLALIILFCDPVSAIPIKKELNSGWKFRQWRLNNWYPATVPGVIHTDLIANGIIEDPFYRLNERSVQWVDKEDWMYETHFDLDDDTFSRENIRLHFMGLDTYVHVYLNGESILEGDNMFREWKVDIKDKVKRKDNKLEVLFRSPIKEDIPKWDALPFQYPTGPDQSQQGGIFNKTVSTFARKAGYHYGWDWGPRLVTSGIWRPVYLEAWNDVKIEDVFIEQKEVSSKTARITAHAELLSDKDLADVKVIIKDKNNNTVYGTKDLELKKGINTVSVDFTIDNPRLWWSNGLGEPNLYEFTTIIDLKSATVDTKNIRTGIRSIKVVNETDKDGASFYFVLNGVPVFAKGANYIPSDNFLPRVTREKYRKTIQDAVDVNMNMLRVWGGGTYEEDYFYDLCDENGIMVWQDFMFACSMYPSEGAYLENVKYEAIDNIKRLRNHPSISVWCGNNEAYDGWFGWGRREDYTKQNPEYARIMWKQYADLFHKLLPDMVAQYAPESFYWPSSPYGLPGQGCDDKHGDRHYWGVWHGKHPIAQYNTEKSRFFSEYGFQSFPEFESVKIYAPKKEDWAITSEVMMEHQRAGTYANNLIEEYLLNEYQKPKDFESFLYMNQVLQGDAIKIAMEAHRRNMPYCMGTLFWQHNDCWPVASWSSRDYYGRWKAQHYFAREAYKDVLVSPIAKDDKLDIYIVSDRLTESKGTLNLKIIKLDGHIIGSRKLNITIPKNTSKNVFTASVNDLLKGTAKNDVVIHAELTDNKGNIYKNNYFLLQQKNINFPQANISKTVKPVNEGYEVSLSSDNFARAVFMSVEGIDNFFENNYFDILPGQVTVVKVKTSLSRPEFEKQLKVVSLRDGF
ncbi:glycoside hydrolase family 2 protein [Dysgonomonas sp. GY75]|uniref:beta-mannosidase n=1 Tax=Dysgonomonas sp. GY75 TaxID=2780419 RepID=UPI001883C0B8|nr:glycoside hydrolase family 2 protein [Dysgonomonas sp. GY75]MBF0651247.1 glycoside hydrolase family 2 protein [Dysgonomonas sp. GY75]